MIVGKLEIAIKINQLPQAKTVDNGWQQFDICDRRIISVTVQPEVRKKLTDAQASYPQWVGAITGKLGQETENRFALEEPNIQVFGRKPKPEAIATAGAAA
ncbi:MULTISPECIES: fertility inhibition FinO-like protein [Nostoc]|uniref:Fertility inhibition FinO-like protein n=2 Tax=Nostoc TaxID=1177 RepID=A0ABR8IL61_9NOSO|nr:MULTISPECIES: fertility inhibition FinO-like protein [Nostoc]MBD2566119.1 fertility inhibition FinO-like protein [Nostoc linckia FACHB-391]MBD2651551.1 fertility inhibition FinO-like protein [Nostoc foliaceum FACHB-393]